MHVHAQVVSPCDRLLSVPPWLSMPAIPLACAIPDARQDRKESTSPLPAAPDALSSLPGNRAAWYCPDHKLRVRSQRWAEQESMVDYRQPMPLFPVETSQPPPPRPGP